MADVPHRFQKPTRQKCWHEGHAVQIRRIPGVAEAFPAVRSCHLRRRRTEVGQGSSQVPRGRRRAVINHFGTSDGNASGAGIAAAHFSSLPHQRASRLGGLTFRRRPESCGVSANRLLSVKKAPPLLARTRRPSGKETTHKRKFR